MNDRTTLESGFPGRRNSRLGCLRGNRTAYIGPSLRLAKRKFSNGMVDAVGIEPITCRLRAHQILALEPAFVDQPAQAGCHHQTALAHRARLRRIEAGTWTGAFRRTELAWISSSCHPGHRCLWVPGSGTMCFSPLSQLTDSPRSRYPVFPTSSAARVHAPRRCQSELNGIIHNR